MNTMPEKDPFTYTLITYAGVIFLSSWGGLVCYIRKIRTGMRRFSLAEFIGELCISAFVGILTFFLCESLKTPQVLSAALIGVSGHMGSRAIFIIEEVFESFIKKWAKHD